MRTGTFWYKRVPTKFLGGVQGMPMRQHAVYSVVLDLIYQHGGSINNDPKWISGWISDMGQAAVRNTIAELVAAGKLRIDGDQIAQSLADVMAREADDIPENPHETARKLRENRGKSGKKGGENSGKSRRAAKENNVLGEAKSPYIEKNREENAGARTHEDEALASLATLIMGPGYCPPSIVTPSRARQLLAAGLVTSEKLRERGIAA